MAGEEEPLDLTAFKHIKKGDPDKLDALLKSKHAQNKYSKYRKYILTPLHYCAQVGETKIAELLLGHRAKVNAANNYGCTPLYVAAENGHSKIVELLLEHGAEVNTADNDWRTPLFAGACKGHKEIVELLLSRGANVNTANILGWTPLFVGVCMGHKEIVEVLLSHGADVKTANTHGWTPLFVGVCKGHKEIVEVLLSRGADVKTKDNDGCTPLHISAENDRKELTEVLLSHGADLNAADNKGRTPLYSGALHGHNEVVKLLLSYGAEVNTADEYGWTPLYAGALNGYKKIVEVLLSHGADVNTANIDGWTPLHAGALNGHNGVVEVLLSHEAKVNTADKYGWTPLYAGASNGHKDVVELLLSHGAKMNTADKDGWTPLHESAFQDHKTIVEVLINHRADIDPLDHNNKTPLMLAEENGHKDIVDILRQARPKQNRYGIILKAMRTVKSCFGYRSSEVKVQRSESGSELKEVLRKSTEGSRQLTETHERLEFGITGGNDKVKVKTHSGRSEIHSQDLDEDIIRNCIRDTFLKYIDPDNVMWLFHKYDPGVLTENDVQQVEARTFTDGPMEGAKLLLNRLPRYKNWFPCLMQVLQDEHVKLGDVAEIMQDKVNDLQNSKLKKLKNSTKEKESTVSKSYWMSLQPTANLVDPYLRQVVPLLQTYWNTVYGLTNQKLLVYPAALPEPDMNQIMQVTIHISVPVVFLQEVDSDGAFNVDEDYGNVSGQVKSNEEALFLAELLKVYNHKLQNIVQHKLEAIQGLSASSPEDKNIRNLTMLKQSLDDFIDVVEKIRFVYTADTVSGSDVNRPSIEEVKDLGKKVCSMETQLKNDRCFDIFANETVTTTYENIWCSILGLCDEFASHLSEMNSRMRMHQSLRYYIESFIESQETLLMKDDGYLEETGRDGIIQRLQKIGFTGEVARVIGESIRDDFIDLQLPSYWATKYLDFATLYHPLLRTCPRYPYNADLTNDWFDTEIPLDKRDEPVESIASRAPFWNIKMINVIDEKGETMVTDFLGELQDEEHELLFHGTCHVSAVSILQSGVELGKGKACQDFSSNDGFYVSTTFENAKGWRRGQKNYQAVVVFRIQRDLLNPQRESGLDVSTDKQMWEEIIRLCRTGYEDTKLKRRLLKDVTFIRGPICLNPRDACTRRPLKGFGRDTDIQVCIRNEDYAHKFGSINNIACVIFY